MINTLRDLFTEDELHTMLKDGITVLRELMTDQKAGQETRRRAADSLLKHLSPSTKEKRARHDDEPPPPQPEPLHDEPSSQQDLTTAEEKLAASDLALNELLNKIGLLGELGFFSPPAGDANDPGSDRPAAADHHELDVPPPPETLAAGPPSAPGSHAARVGRLKPSGKVIG